jgi:Arc-like DNA binding domain
MSASALNSKSDIFTMRMPREHREKLIAAARKRNRSLANYLVVAGLTAEDRAWELEPRHSIPAEIAA